jgi:hypothetical protein
LPVSRRTFDAVLHFAALAVELLVQLARFPLIGAQ